MGFIGLAGGGGGLSQKIVVDRRWGHPIGHISLDEAVLIEPFSVGHPAYVRSGANVGDTALVGGAGPIGLLLAAVLKAQGLTVIISEIGEARNEKARSTGVADHVIDPSRKDLVAGVRALTEIKLVQEGKIVRSRSSPAGSLSTSSSTGGSTPHQPQGHGRQGSRTPVVQRIAKFISRGLCAARSPTHRLRCSSSAPPQAAEGQGLAVAHHPAVPRGRRGP